MEKREYYVTVDEMKRENSAELGDKMGFEGWEYTDFVWVMKKIFKNKFRIRK